MKAPSFGAISLGLQVAWRDRDDGIEAVERLGADLPIPTHPTTTASPGTSDIPAAARTCPSSLIGSWTTHAPAARTPPTRPPSLLDDPLHPDSSGDPPTRRLRCALLISPEGSVLLALPAPEGREERGHRNDDKRAAHWASTTGTGRRHPGNGGEGRGGWGGLRRFVAGGSPDAQALRIRTPAAVVT